MSTTGISTWAVDLANVGAIYPFQGTVVLLTFFGVVTWLGWHVWCVRWEKQYHDDNIRDYGDRIKESIDSNYPVDGS